jgi:hypothetical protein
MMQELKLILALADVSQLEYFLRNLQECRRRYGDETTLKTLEAACNEIMEGKDPWTESERRQAGYGLPGDPIPPKHNNHNKTSYLTGPLRRLWNTSKK